jgi:hypothetical protein
MSSHIPKEGRGVLFQNLEKKTETHPDYKGQVMVEGKIIRLSAWKKTHPNGHLFSLSVMKTPQEMEREAISYPREVKRNDDSDVPF